jgi:hypothetical protein
MIPRSLASPCPHCPLAAESSRGVVTVGRKKRRLTGNWALCDCALRSAGPASLSGLLSPGSRARGPRLWPETSSRPSGPDPAGRVG